jgi:hypothetical protein
MSTNAKKRKNVIFLLREKIVNKKKGLGNAHPA